MKKALKKKHKAEWIMEMRTIKLENNEKYIIANEANIEGRCFYQVIKVDDETDFEIVEKIGEDVVFIDDDIVKAKVIQEMCQNLADSNK